MAYVSQTNGGRGKGRPLHPREISGGAVSETETASADAAALADDSSSGLALFVLFTIAVLVVTGAVAVLALLNSWWALGLAFGVHVLVTIVVGSALFAVLSGKPNPRSTDDSLPGAAPGLESQAADSSTDGRAVPIAA